MYGKIKPIHLSDGDEFFLDPGVNVKYLESRRSIIIAVGYEDSLLALENLLKKSVSQ